ncbi:extracellular solute-binding protein [Paenibacillus sp. DLE-14]|uniref:Extracellular solute-binding protein n=2 Tax=Paenibacillus lignilyticus TaxID=1172615 RepID=A0ABS5C9J5_9BACL|nr:extracellular solute-binding protein [Paenibacillus lignilyticus]
MPVLTSKRITYTLAAAALCSSMLTSCASHQTTDKIPSPSPSQKEENTGEQKQLTVLTNRIDLVENGVFQKYADKFEAKHPGAHVEFEGLTNYASDIIVRLSTRSLGDVLLLPNNLPNEDLINYFEPLNDSLFEHTRFADFKSYRGERYGIATGASTDGIVYNKTAFLRAGITKVPATLEEFYAACAKLKRVGIVPIYLNYGAQWPMSSWGENLVSYMTGNANYLNQMTASDQPFTKENPWGQTIAIVKTLINKGYVEKDLFTNNWELSKGEVAKGNAGMYFLGNWVINQVIAAGGSSEDLGFFPFPYDNTPMRYAPLSPDWFLGVSKFSENKELAEAWANFFVKESGYVDDSGFLPVDTTKTSQLPQIRQFLTFDPTFVERQPPSDDFLNISAKAQMAFWSGDYIQEWIAAPDLKTSFQNYNVRWAEARKLVLGLEASNQKQSNEHSANNAAAAESDKKKQQQSRH